jgi:hypothetical protein
MWRAWSQLLIGVLLAGCLSVRLPPEPEVTTVEKTDLTVGVVPPKISDEFPDINDSVADEVADELAGTGLFASAYRMTVASPTPDLVVHIVELKKADPRSWCAESYVYSVFTLFVVPGCAWSLGYRLNLEARGSAPIEFDYQYEALHLSGWVALFTHLLPGWYLPRADKERRLQYLKVQLAPILPSLRQEPASVPPNKALQQTRRLFSSEAGVVASEQHHSGVGCRRRRAPRS